MQEKVFISVCHLLKLWPKKFQCELNSSSINEQGIVAGKVMEQSLTMLARKMHGTAASDKHFSMWLWINEWNILSVCQAFSRR